LVVRREWICLTWIWSLIKCWRSWSRNSGGCGGMALLQVMGIKVFFWAEIIMDITVHVTMRRVLVFS
jgi:hypothetical protein